MVRKNAMLTVVNPPIDPLGPQAFELDMQIQDVLREMEGRGQTTIPRLRRGKQYVGKRMTMAGTFAMVPEPSKD